MTRFKFVHAADLHLDTPFEGLGRVEPAVASSLRDASLDAWDALVSLTITEGASFIVLAGDIYDGEMRGVRAQLRFFRGLERLSERGIGAFVAYGNHDPDGARWSAIRDWPPHVFVFGSDRVRSVPAVRKDGVRLAVVHGISHASREVADNLALGFARGPEPGLHVGVLHCNVDRDPDHPLYAPCTSADLRRARMDYWALGHIHAHRVLSNCEPVAVYAGTLQGRSLKQSERDVKGALVVTVEDGRVGSLRFVPVAGVRFLELAIDIRGVGDIAALARQMEEAAAAELSRAPAAGLVLGARLRGRGALHAALRPAPAVEDLLRALRERAPLAAPFTWWSSVSNETAGEIDVEAIRKRGDFTAELVRMNDSIRNDEAALAAFFSDETAELQSPGFRKWASDAAGSACRLVEEAEMLALDQLEARSGR